MNRGVCSGALEIAAPANPHLTSTCRSDRGNRSLDSVDEGPIRMLVYMARYKLVPKAKTKLGIEDRKMFR